MHHVESVDWWAILAAVATLLSALFIASQAWYTRASVRDAEKILGDAQKARIDADMPRLSLLPERVTLTTARTDQYNGDIPVRESSAFNRQADGHIEVKATIAYSVVNDGPRQADIAVELPAGSQFQAFPIYVPANERTPLFIHWVETVEAWIQLHEKLEQARRTNQPHPHVLIATLTYAYPGDRGATETHEIWATGSALTTVNDGESWQGTPTNHEEPGISTRPQPFQRVYWASRSKGDRLDSSKSNFKNRS